MPIGEASLRRGVNTGISYAPEYEVWNAAIEAGATLTELEKLYAGGYSSRFLAKLLAWHRARGLIETHTNDAIQKASEAKIKR